VLSTSLVLTVPYWLILKLRNSSAHGLLACLVYNQRGLWRTVRMRSAGIVGQGLHTPETVAGDIHALVFSLLLWRVFCRLTFLLQCWSFKVILVKQSRTRPFTWAFSNLNLRFLPIRHSQRVANFLCCARIYMICYFMSDVSSLKSILVDRTKSPSVRLLSGWARYVQFFFYWRW